MKSGTIEEAVSHDLVPVLEFILERFEQKCDGRAICKLCGCLMLPSDLSCPGCRAQLTVKAESMIDQTLF